jgi:hypothetical protein
VDHDAGDVADYFEDLVGFVRMWMKGREWRGGEGAYEAEDHGYHVAPCFVFDSKVQLEKDVDPEYACV